MSIKPWLGSIREPTGFIKPLLKFDKSTTIQMKLDQVYGYKAMDCRNILKYLKSGNNIAALAIVIDINTGV